MVKAEGVTTADSDIPCSWEGWISVFDKSSMQKSILRLPVELSPRGNLSGKPYTAEESKGRVSPFPASPFRSTLGRTKVGNSVENKGFSTALILRLRSTI